VSVPEAKPSAAAGLPVSPALAAELTAEFPPPRGRPLDRRVVWITLLACGLGVAATAAAQLLLGLIRFFTNFAFHGEFSLEPASPLGNGLGLWVIGVPVIGGIVVGLMARYGSKAIRGHGIPEAMEQVLTNESRIPMRILFLKPISAAIAIGTGGPFGAEGPIIATGGALGSLVGQVLSVTAAERKTLLAAGAAAGMTAVFGTPVSAVLLAIELLLFEYRGRSLIPVALATVVAALGHALFEGTEAVLKMPEIAAAGGAALGAYLMLGALIGLAAVGITRLIYRIEDGFEKLPLDWMWWPALGGAAVGIVGYFAPRTLGIGYQNLDDLLAGNLTLTAALTLGLLKLTSWSLSLGSGTSGGTLAPLLTIGGCLGAAFGYFAARFVPAAGVDPRMAALVGMAALFAGSARAPMASTLFAFEAVRRPEAILPLLAGCAVAYLVSCLTMRNSIMTEKIERRGVPAPTEYVPDVLGQVLVRHAAEAEVVTLPADDCVAEVRRWLDGAEPGRRHQGYPVVNPAGRLVGVVTRKEVFSCERDEQRLADILRRPPVVVYDDCTVREAVEQMVRHEIGRLPVVSRSNRDLVGMLTRSDVLAVYARRLHESRVVEGLASKKRKSTGDVKASKRVEARK
jgi:H+/Cl- antiporter ClcA